MVTTGKLFPDVVEQRTNDSDTVARSADRARKVDDQRSSDDASNAPRQRRRGNPSFESGRPDGFGDARNLTFDDASGDLWCPVVWGQPRTPGRQHCVDTRRRCLAQHPGKLVLVIGHHAQRCMCDTPQREGIDDGGA